MGNYRKLLIVQYILEPKTEQFHINAINVLSKLDIT